MASYVSAARTVLRELGVEVPSEHSGIKAALAGYRNLYHVTYGFDAKRLPWPIQHSARAVTIGRRLLLLPNVTAKQVLGIRACAHVNAASITFCRSDSTNKMKVYDFQFDNDGNAKISVRAQKNLQGPHPVQHQPRRVMDERCPAQFLHEFLESRHACRQPSCNNVFGMTLDDAVRRVCALLHDNTNFTSHCIRIGSVSDAQAIGVPLHRIAYIAGHKSTDTTIHYVRYDVPPCEEAKIYFGYLHPNYGIRNTAAMANELTH